MRKKNANSQTGNNEITKKKVNKKSIIAYSISGTAVVALGVVAGILLGQNVFKIDAYKGLNADVIEQDYSETYKEFQKAAPSSYTTKFTPVELVNISLLKLSDYENFYTLTQGQVIAAGVKQTIRSTTIKDGNQYFEESLSASSFVKSANRFYQNENDVTWYKGKYVDLENGSYGSAKQTKYSLNEYEEVWGKLLSQPCIYIISDKTCLGSELTESKDGYTINLDLHPTYSVLRYVKQMVMTGGLSESPVFHSVKLIFELDKDMNLVTFKTDEVYDVHMVIDAKNSKASLTQNYYYQERRIPTITEPTSYK